ncbi:MAG: SDR family oxidoreductase [Bacteroidales bacterium]|nr:SDR family oxidoreductase [Bacteroidales bacterium]
MIQSKVVIITGAGSGIGRALAVDFSTRSYAIVLVGRKVETLHETANLLNESVGGIMIIPADVSKEIDCRAIMEKTIEKFGRIDVLINNAGISMRALFEDSSLDVIRLLMDVNFWGTVYCSKYALPHLLNSKGSLVGIISIAGYIGLPGRSAYSASKFAVRGFLNTIRVENSKKGLHVLVAAPGFTASNIRFTALTADGQQQGSSPRNEDKMMTAETAAFYISNAIIKRKRSLILTFKEGKLTVFLSKFFPSLIDRLSYNHMAKEPDSPFK